MLTGKRGRQAREYRRVVRYETVIGPNGGERYRLALACGHVVERPRRWREEVQQSVRCGWCEGKGLSGTGIFGMEGTKLI
jgi:hypothetical protein